MRNLFYAITLLIFFTGTTTAQYNLGVATSNWSGTNSVYLNPANIADSRERFTIDIFSINGGIDNSLGTLSTTGGIFKAISDGNTSNMFSYTSNKQFSLMAPYVQAHLPGCMVSINHRHSLALTTGIRGMNQFNNFDRTLYRTLTDPTYLPDGNLDLTSNHFNYTAHVWSEVGVSYAAVLVDGCQHELKVGLTLKYLGGIGYLGLKGNNLDAHYKSGIDSLFVTRSDLEFASNIISTRNAIFNGISNHNILSEFFGSKDGSGIGADFGIVYEYTPDPADPKLGPRDHTKNRYLLRFSASVMDIGAITYHAGNNSNANVTGNGFVSGKDFSANVHNYEDFRQYAVSHGFTADTAHHNTKVYMPTTLHIDADYHAYKRIYLNASFIVNLANRQNFGTSYYNQVTLTPRYDSRNFSVGAPITYGFLSNSVKVGLGVRLSGFFIGSDDMLAIIAKHQSGFNFYVGGFVPFHKHRPKGSYGYNESDTTDNSVPEPDSEHGGSMDSTDNCPDVPYDTDIRFKDKDNTYFRQTENGMDGNSSADRNRYIDEELEKH